MFIGFIIFIVLIFGVGNVLISIVSKLKRKQAYNIVFGIIILDTILFILNSVIE